ncbi:scavenger receptor class B member 1 [Sarcoptes scabiei]|nr:scavenger receptor class B member 1 [Sarcoptes scabiei]
MINSLSDSTSHRYCLRSKCSANCSCVDHIIDETLESTEIAKDHNQNYFLGKNSDESPKFKSSHTHTDTHKNNCLQLKSYPSIDEEIRRRYLQYIRLENLQRDQCKTDYTYAHSYSYSPLVPFQEQFNWLVPNMSRPSIRYQNDSTLVEGESVTRKFLQSIPVSQIKNLDRIKNSDSTIIKRNKLPVLHSTPLKHDLVIRNGANSEFSDDDRDENDINDPTIRDLKQSNNKTSRTRFKIYAHNKGYDEFEQNQFSEDENEAGFAIIKKLKYFLRSLFRSEHQSAIQESTNNIDVNSRLTSNSNRFMYRDSSNQIESHENFSNLEIPHQNLTNRWSTKLRMSKNSNNGNNFNPPKYFFKRFWEKHSILLSSLLLLLLCIFFILFNKHYLRLSLSDFDYEFPHRFIAFIPNVLTSFLPSFPTSFFNSNKAPSNEDRSKEFKNFDNSFGFGDDTSKITSELLSIRNELAKLNQNQNSQESQNNQYESSLKMLVEKINILESRLNSCCRKNFDEFEYKIQSLVAERIEKFKLKSDTELRDKIDSIKLHLLELINENYSKINESLMQKFDLKNTFSSNEIQNSDIDRLIQSALAKYDADKTGETDYALESSGAWIMNTRCSETYELHPASYKLFGVTLWRSSNSPRIVIQSGVVPGECWCFKGAEGRLAIHLSARIIPTAFSYEHIPIELSRDGHILSAPDRFIVYGLRTEDDTAPLILGEYRYKMLNLTENQQKIQDRLQRFPVIHIQTAQQTFDMIELDIKSNHGHPKYTCLYRFRVHGHLPASNKNSLV